MMRREILAAAIAALLATPAARADIFWTDPYDTARSQADWGSNAPGGSALGQLEGITGQTVDRTSPKSSLPPRPASAPAPRSTPSAKARSDAAAMEAMAAGILVLSVLQAMDAQADAQARAAAEAERQRQLEAERQRQLRQQSAARQRAAWDAQEAQDNADLSSIFSGNGGGTAFFGSGNSVDPARLKDMNRSTPAAPDFKPAFVPPPPTPWQAQLLERGQGFVRDSTLGLLKKAATEAAPPQVKYSKNALEYADRANDFIDDLFKALSPEALVKALADSDPESSQHLLSKLDRVSARASRLAFNQDSINNGEIEATARLLSGNTLSREEMEAIAEERLRSSIVDRIWGRFTGED